MDCESGASRCRLVCIEQISKTLLCGTGNYIQYLLINHHGKEHKNNVCMCITESLCCIAVTNNTANHLHHNKKASFLTRLPFSEDPASSFSAATGPAATNSRMFTITLLGT